MRLNRFLAACGLGSRRACEELVDQRRVLINGKEVTELAISVEPTDVVIVDGRKVKPSGGVTLIMNKPPGVLTSREDETGMRRDTVYRLLPPNLHSLHYVGRLDYESEGLLIITSSGELTEKLTHPRFGIEKEYLIKLHKPFNYDEDGPKMLEGFDIEGGFAKATALEFVSPRVISLVLTQGIKRQIRYMLEALGYHVRRLQRVRIGSFVMPELKSGRWRVLTEEEVSHLLDENTERFRVTENDQKKSPAKKTARKAPAKKRSASSRQQKPFVPGRNARNSNFDERHSSPSRAARSAYPRKLADRTERARPERAHSVKSARGNYSTERSYSERKPRSTASFSRESSASYRRPTADHAQSERTRRESRRSFSSEKSPYNRQPKPARSEGNDRSSYARPRTSERSSSSREDRAERSRRSSSSSSRSFPDRKPRRTRS